MSALVVVFVLGAARPGATQLLPWFNGIGLSAGGGPVTTRGHSDSPLTHFVRPTPDSGGAAGVGALLFLGNRQWSLVLPEFHAFSPLSSDADPVDASLRVGTQTLDFQVDTQTTSLYVVTLGAQASPFQTGWLWVRGGLGQGWFSKSVRAKDQEIGVDLSSGSGLAWSAAAGARLWSTTLDEGRTMTVDLEADYVVVRQDSLRVRAPSVRVSWRMVFLSLFDD